MHGDSALSSSMYFIQAVKTKKDSSGYPRIGIGELCTWYHYYYRVTNFHWELAPMKYSYYRATVYPDNLSVKMY